MREYVLSIGGKEYKSEVKEMTSEFARILINEKEYKIEIKEFGHKNAAIHSAKRAETPISETKIEKREVKKSKIGSIDSGTIKAPLPGLILEVFVKVSDSVKAGQDLFVMESMKMENQIQATHDGTVEKIYIKRGDSVAEGDILLELSRPMMTTL